MGYIMGGFTLGSYIDLASGMWRRSAVDIDLRWFSNLFMVRRSRIRQFLAFNYTQGWNRLQGNDESIRFTHVNGLQALKEHITGTNRMILNTETVIFTPYQPLGFRIALFGFADFGLLGYSPNIFKNEFYTSFGLGVRLRNERLVFNTIQIRLGLALGKPGLVESDFFRISNSTRLEPVPLPPDTARDRRIRIAVPENEGGAATLRPRTSSELLFRTAYGSRFPICAPESRRPRPAPPRRTASPRRRSYRCAPS